MTATHYQSSSKGLIEIATMQYRHLLNSHNVLVRDQIAGERQDEIDAMRARLDVLEAEFDAAESAKAEAAQS